jgi:diguanylate cyclase (GGDEF)-like protein
MANVDLQTFRLVTDLLPEAVLLVEPCGRIRAANRRAHAALAPAGERLDGRELPSFAGERADHVRGLLETCIAGRAPWPARMHLHGADGRLRAYTAFGDVVSAPDRRDGALVQLRLRPSEPVRRPTRLHDRLHQLEGQLEHLRCQVAAELRLRERVDGLQRRLAAEIQQRHAIAAAARRLEWAAFHDGLTGLANRTLFRDRMDRAVTVARRDGDRIGVLVIDLDGFKAVNDTLGHHAGDAVLRAVARRLRAIVRDADTVARLGGDEFAVLMETGADRAGIAAVATKVAQALDLPFTVEGCAFDLGASIGAALYPDDGDDADAVLRHADRAMYRVKRAGEPCRARRPASRQRAREPLRL